MQKHRDTFRHRFHARALFVAGLSLVATMARAAQIDIHLPPSGSTQVGYSVTVLPNGNIVVADPHASTVASEAGAVYLYSPAGILISTLNGSNPNDLVGGDAAGYYGGVVVVGGGNFVVVSPNWKNGSAGAAGAVTWVDGAQGLSDAVSANNSLVGTTANDKVGVGGVTVLSNGNYVAASPNWNGNVGAATWANGNTGRSGVVSLSNSLVGTTASDQVAYGGIIALSTGNYVVASPYWNGVRGAATWGNGATGMSAVVSTGNSVVGTTANDRVGYDGVTTLGNGNYVIVSADWNGLRGAATWADGGTGLTGAVSASNSLVGTSANDSVGYSGVVALSNGNYVVGSPRWNGARGAATWANGSTGLSGAVSASNSLVGATANDQVSVNSSTVASRGITALSNSNYVVSSPNWNGNVGAATWANGGTGLSGVVSSSNSLVGTTANDHVSVSGVTALSNGNYVVASPYWNGFRGAATWANGSAALSAVVSSSNSLVGTTANDGVGSGVTALINGNYVTSSSWNGVGAVTWANGSTGLSGAVTASNSMVGSASYNVGGGVTALSNGNYVIASPYWNNSPLGGPIGAATWANGSRSLSSTISASNSLVGTSYGDHISELGAIALSDGNYVILSPRAASHAGAITLASERFRLKGKIQPWNSVQGGVGSAGGSSMSYAYDASRHRLVVGRPADHIVSLFTMDQIFADTLEP